MNSKTTAYLLLLITSMIWGFGGPILKHTLGYIHPFNFLFWRFTLTSLIALPIFIWYIKRNPIKVEWVPKMILAGLLATTINLSFVISGFARTSAIEASLLISVSPLFVVIGGCVFLKEKLNNRARLGVAFALMGALISATGPLIFGNNRSNSESFLGNIFILCGGLVWMIFVLLSKRWEKEGIKPFHIASMSFFVGPLTFLPMAILEGGKLPSITSIPQQAYFGMFYMAIFSSIVAYTAYETGLSKIQASKADVFQYLQSVWAAPLALVWLGETLPSTYLIGLLFVITGLILAEFKPGAIKGIGLLATLNLPLRGHHLANHK
ncbi:MAG: hypothetical protein A3D24_01165 [Candidatus Blackburnbacteria bacterium RIFCSPHIGHO2_02_FULL_39_13]|uniref:EamA domain-containing protein n=1 Tax=Candidatus Blackburnbacteria bacterium RIFCSPLOWO2_01_FULL_40_20 TaxID=1797519 RepID=A0A1G1VFG7_9BACT|nr:MAG: hypothetical protein A2694_04345 [Candidatus Blackburnbacteria bacterium RIFCSPHIGHO2_01_FULL_40_17]OGY08069.1 MAG: hypothetical protein A3D24_01165 [Candidatus Blackburnbacteria bacterium RIFCSPHIGHO2_02_FULL_39_13]OGY14158.1 MAG: hypothetical protein A3A77_04845 [Candidatus Blackburnbacteria bacterium RIFCSPLOWO2_01_FULL_40_20]OGY15454.1 MAG: hypothetical protein A3I52_01970 [Candidatus Blackburnbacteria bacterium RIFCSPLOWO2_02_FULL_40_10]HBL52156.1 hypothetical protein [Candidatus B